MAWQAETGSGSSRATNQTATTGDSVARDLLTKLAQFACSQHVATAEPTGGSSGSGYVVGDVVTLTHASAHLDAKFEVTSVGGSGEITGLRINCSGAFAQQATSASVSAGGSGYNTGDIIAVDGGSSRLPAKFQVTAAAGAVSSVVVYEGGGAYSSTPSNPAATTKVGPLAGSGSGATLTVTYQSIVGTSALAVTGGTGSSATVDITLAQTGWSVDGRDRNDWDDDDQGNTDQKQVTLVGDATGFTNKPYVHLTTGYTTSGVDTRCWIQVNMSLAHNPALDIDAQPGLGGGYVTDNGCFALMPENSHDSTLTTVDTDFWFSANDTHLHVQYNADTDGGNGDDGRYMFLHAGFFERLGTESEYPFPGLFGASSRNRDLTPLSGSTDISSIGELMSAGNGPCYYYQAESAAWHILRNTNGSVGESTDMTFPYGDHPTESDGADPHLIVTDYQVVINTTCIRRDRSSSTRVLRPSPGTTDQYMLYPLAIVRQETNTPDESTDSPKGQIQGCFWLYNDDGSGNRVPDFSEDYITIGSDRYRIFHNHTHESDRYQYVAILEDV